MSLLFQKNLLDIRVSRITTPWTWRQDMLANRMKQFLNEVKTLRGLISYTREELETHFFIPPKGKKKLLKAVLVAFGEERCKESGLTAMLQKSEEDLSNMLQGFLTRPPAQRRDFLDDLEMFLATIGLTLKGTSHEDLKQRKAHRQNIGEVLETAQKIQTGELVVHVDGSKPILEIIQEGRYTMRDSIIEYAFNTRSSKVDWYGQLTFKELPPLKKLFPFEATSNYTFKPVWVQVPKNTRYRNLEMRLRSMGFTSLTAQEVLSLVAQHPLVPSIVGEVPGLKTRSQRDVDWTSSSFYVLVATGCTMPGVAVPQFNNLWNTRKYPEKGVPPYVVAKKIEE